MKMKIKPYTQGRSLTENFGKVDRSIITNLKNMGICVANGPSRVGGGRR